MNLEKLIELGVKVKGVEKAAKKYSKAPYANLVVDLISAVGGEEEVLRDFPGIDPAVTRNLSLGEYESILAETDKKVNDELIESVQERYESIISDYFSIDDEGRQAMVSFVSEMEPVEHEGVDSRILEAHKEAYEARKTAENPGKAFGQLLKKHQDSVFGRAIAFSALKNPKIAEIVMVNKAAIALNDFYEATGNIMNAKNYMRAQYQGADDEKKKDIAYDLGMRITDDAIKAEQEARAAA